RRLYLSCAEGKNFDGSPRYPSRFVLDIDENLLDLVREPADLLIKNAKAYIEHSEKFLPGRPAATVNLFSPGDHIMHPILGEGHVLEVNPDKGTYLISFTKTSTPRTISCKVKMEKA
ncbi:MAG: DNA helicase UvrD, partial [Blautia sp.]|nr:DNA helicase UvrD [Blautia sp.]